MVKNNRCPPYGRALTIAILALTSGSIFAVVFMEFGVVAMTELFHSNQGKKCVKG